MSPEDQAAQGHHLLTIQATDLVRDLRMMFGKAASDKILQVRRGVHGRTNHDTGSQHLQQFRITDSELPHDITHGERKSTILK